MWVTHTATLPRTCRTLTIRLSITLEQAKPYLSRKKNSKRTARQANGCSIDETEKGEAPPCKGVDNGFEFNINGLLIGDNHPHESWQTSVYELFTKR